MEPATILDLCPLSGAPPVYARVERYQRFLPLPPLAHVVLVALAGANLNCLEIVDEIERDSRGFIKPPAQKVMDTIRKLMVRDLVEASPLQPDPEDHDDLRCWYTLTLLGMQVAAAETQRVTRLVHAAIDKKLVSRAQISAVSPSSSGSYRL